MNRVTGGGLPARLWGRVVGRALAGLPPKPLPGGTAEIAAAPEDESFLERLVRKLTGGGSEGGGGARGKSFPIQRDR